ncbi:MAG: hypothetical protein HDT48_03455, partial [Ruminococcaceae bacterium]|nr:hypothetical protein [Oscillospiraceae bacterium]
MKMKKILAGVLAGAMAVASIAITNVFADDKTANVPIASPDGEWTEIKLVDSSSPEMEGVDVVGVDKVIFNAVAWDINYGWNNGAFYSNSNGASYKSVKFGGAECEVDVLLEKVGKFSVEVEIDITDGWFELGGGTSTTEGAFELESIEFYKGSEKVGTWANNQFTAAADEGPLLKNTPIASPDGEWTEIKLVDSSSPEMEG